MKKLVALFVVMVFSVNLFAQAQPQKKAEPEKPKTETSKLAVEKKSEVKPEKTSMKHVKKMKKAEEPK